MKLTASEFIDKAEGLKQSEINTRQRLEQIRSERQSIQNAIETQQYRLESLYAELDSIERFSDGETDNSALIASIQSSISSIQEMIHEYKLQDNELREKEDITTTELHRIELQEQDTLLDIQDSATRTNQNISLMSSIGGDYGNVAAQATSSFQQNLGQLSQAAQILGGNVPLNVPGVGGGFSSSKRPVRNSTQSPNSSSRNLYEAADAQRNANIPVHGSIGAKSSNSQKKEPINNDLYSSISNEEYETNPKKKGGLGRKVISAVSNAFSSNYSHSTQALKKGLFCERYTDLNQLSDDVYQSANDYVENHTDYNSLLFNHQTTQQIEHLRDVINQHGIPEDEILFRRATSADLGSKLSNLPIEQIVGKCYLFDGIMSTGPKKMADTVSHGDVIFEIKVPKGLPGLDLTQVASFQEAMFDSPFCYIESAEKTANGETHIVISILSTGQDTKLFRELNEKNVYYRPITEYGRSRTSAEIIGRLGGGDMTIGSCSSLALAYAGNVGGYDVLDFRDGTSRIIFSDNDSIEAIANLSDVESTIIYGTNDYECSHKLFDLMEENKEYYFAVAQHAAVIRKNNGRIEYLELQTTNDNGWHILNDNRLNDRFGCEANESDTLPNFLISIESLSNSIEFRNLLGFVNTSEANQVKGVSGFAR